MPGAGADVFSPNENIEVIIPLPPCSILYAELKAIERALEEIRSLPAGQSEDCSFVILTDSKSSLQTLDSYKPSEYYHQCESIRKLLKEIQAQVTLQWIPSHVGIRGNDQADYLAKLAAESGPVNLASDSISSLMCKIHRTTLDVWCERWKNDSSGRLYFEIQKKPNQVRYQHLSREDQVNLSRLKMHHYPTQSYLHRFGLDEESICPLCDQEEETIHHLLFRCPSLKEQRTFDADSPWCEVIKNQKNEWTAIANLLRERKRRLHARAMTS